jgi:tripartite-type tricarboxylate transporter receptor subunit TctC
LTSFPLVKRFEKVLLFGLAALASLPLCSAANAQDADADFFQGKTVTYIVSAEPGGGYDTYGRLLTRYLEKHLPGTRFVVRNLPGAGTIIGANTLYVARPDGLTFGTFGTGLIYSQLLELEGLKIDLRRMSWIGRMAEEGRSLVLAGTSGLTSAEDLLHVTEPVLLATSGVGASNHIESRIMVYALGIDAMLVPNMEAAETEMSMIRGEISGSLGSESSLSDFVRQGHGTFVLLITRERSVLTDVPQAEELISREDARPLLSLIEAVAGLGRLSAGPPGIPPSRLAVLRRAFDAAVSDPGLLADAQALQIPIDPGRGEEVETEIRTVLDQPEEIVALFKRVGGD